MAKRQYFGTDGVRGVANKTLTPEFVLQLGRAVGEQISAGTKVVIGRDTRYSGPMLESAMAAGLCAAGVTVDLVGVIPTGGISYLTRTEGYALGVVISASHNPAPDNGIKLIAKDGKKVTDQFEFEVEQRLGQAPESPRIGADLGTIRNRPEVVESYKQYLVSLCPERLDGLAISMDCSNGAAYELAPEVFMRLGADITVIGDQCDGLSINAECGATKPETISQHTRQAGNCVGVAFDGDADRAVFSDELGRLVNGDRLMAIWSKHWRKAGLFEPPVIVGTVMSNGAFAAFAAENGIELVRADVGDKHVAAKMESLQAKVGGEQSGHIIFADLSPTGDGLITAIELCKILRREDRRLVEFLDDFENWPQLLVNVSVEQKDGWSENALINQTISEASARLGEKGRVNVRASGTQPMLRVMVESEDRAAAEAESERIVRALLGELGGSVYSRVDLTNALGD